MPKKSATPPPSTEAASEGPTAPKAGKKQQTVIRTEVIVPDHMSPAGPGQTSSSGRMLAALMFLTSLDGITLEELSQHPELKEAGVTLGKLQGWSVKGKWVEQRKLLFGRAFARVRIEMEKVLEVRLKLRLTKLHTLEEKLWTALQGAEIKSLEGGIKAYVTLLEAIRVAESDVTGAVDLLGQRVGAQKDGPSATEFDGTPEDVRQLSRKLMADRRALVTIVPPPPPKEVPKP